MNLEEEIRRDADNAIKHSKPVFDMIDQIFNFGRVASAIPADQQGTRLSEKVVGSNPTAPDTLKSELEAKKAAGIINTTKE